MVPLGLPRSRSSTGSSCGFHDLAPSAPTSSNLLRPSDAESSKQHAGRRLSKMRNIITSTLTKSHSQYPLPTSNYTQTLPAARPKVRRTISRSMIAPLQHLFGGDHNETEMEEAERYENQPWSMTLTKASISKHHRRGATAVLYQPTLSDDDEEWDFRCQGMAPVIPARPSEEDTLSPDSAYSHSFLGSPGYIVDPAFFNVSSSAASCCSSPGPCHAPVRSLSADGSVKKQKISVDSISAPLNLWSPRSLSPLPAPPHRSCTPFS
ncbi:hypothetical protein PCANC_04854 [Puccinia coronata f. sp. avenae]|uniref:Uncharacterized protein n=1 Tax=Puccinia coronata f. sp. avenae TaxID=200324 RepID=A0A2N5TET8_9BASI|nr:hypothetical protein PCASD_14935 [Puccinia coronata f. sp. avenae]PLW56438.1 hypothetical protein PCANC_04854 [Puccinia coronata f. sp. avenae]